MVEPSAGPSLQHKKEKKKQCARGILIRATRAREGESSEVGGKVEVERERETERR